MRILKRLPDEIARGVLLGLLLGGALIVAMWASPRAIGREWTQTYPCGAQPPLIVLLPDGSSIRADSVTHHPATRVVDVRVDRLACGGFED